MKDEIKELTIDILLEELNNWKPQYPMELIHIGQRQMAMILDYITTLQEENEKLQDIIAKDRQFNENRLLDYIDYKARIDKAIEYIKSKEFINYKKGLGNFERMLKHRQDLLDILQGDDNNAKD